MDERIHERYRDALTPTLRGRACEQGNHRTERGEVAGGRVGDGRPGLERRAVLRPGRVHHAGERLRDRVETGSAGIGPGRSEPAHGDRHETGVAGPEGFVVDAEAFLRRGPQVVDQDVRTVTQLEEQIAARPAPEVHRDAALVAVDADEHAALAVAVRAEGAGFVAAYRLDLDDVGTAVAEHRSSERPGHHGCCVDHADARQGARQKHAEGGGRRSRGVHELTGRPRWRAITLRWICGGPATMVAIMPSA